MTKTIKAKPWREVSRSRKGPARRAAVAHRVQEESIAITLADLRKQLGLTKTEAAELYEVTQGQISQLEHRSDHLLSTLRRYVEAVGGRLEIAAVVGDKRILLNL